MLSVDFIEIENFNKKYVYVAILDYNNFKFILKTVLISRRIQKMTNIINFVEYNIITRFHYKGFLKKVTMTGTW